MKTQARGQASDMPPHLEKEGVVPIYVQLAHVLEKRIRDHGLPPGAKIESEAELCAQFGISRVTVRLAIDELTKKGLVERKQGKGTYVSGSAVRHEPADVNQFFDSIFASGVNPISTLLTFGPEKPPLEIRTLFGLDAGTELMRLDRLFVLDDRKVGFSQGWMPLAARQFPMAIAKEKSSAKLLAEMGYGEVGTEVSINAGLAGEHAARYLDLPVHAPVLLMERNRFSQEGGLIENVHFTMNPSLYRFSFSTGMIRR